MIHTYRYEYESDSQNGYESTVIHIYRYELDGEADRAYESDFQPSERRERPGFMFIVELGRSDYVSRRPEISDRPPERDRTSGPDGSYERCLRICNTFFSD